MTDLADFIQQHATPYDPATDSYRRPPFALPVKAGKNSPIYNAHSYHTKVPPEGIVPYIEHYTSPGDLILDPFCGSGMTGVAALMTGRHAILNDLSPAAVHIARNYTTPVDVIALKREFERIKAAVKEEFDWLYATTCDRCGGPATIQHTIWSDVFACGRCGGEIVLWDVAVNPTTGKVSEKFICPNCGKNQTKKGLHRISTIPVITCYECSRCKPSRAIHPVTEVEKKRVTEIEVNEIPYWHPINEFPLGRQTRKLREGTAGISHVDQLFTKRNLWAFARLWYETQNSPTLISSLRFGLTAIVQRCSRLNRLRPSGAGDPMSGVLYAASLTREENVLELWSRKFIDHQKLTNRKLMGNCVAVVGSATELQIPSDTISYIFTDPPFGSNLQYAELNFLTEAWLKQFSDWPKDAVMNYVHKKDLAFYSDMMGQAFAEMFRVLKSGRWASVVFHNTDDAVWRAIQEGAQRVGFEVVNAMAFDKKQGTFNQVNMGKDSAAGFDVILNLVKPHKKKSNGLAAQEIELDVLVTQIVADYLAKSPEPNYRTTQFLHSYVIRQLLEKNVVIERISIPYLEEMLPYHFKQVNDRWYLRGEQVIEGGLGLIVEDEATAIAWLTRILTNESQEFGNLLPQWQMATLQVVTGKIGKSLEQILSENFWQDQRTGRWRLPTPAEREKMSARIDLSAQAHLRVVRRYLAGELDRRPSQPELAAWLRFCYSREFFSEAAQLFPHLDESQLEAEDYRAIKRMATVSKMRAGQ